MLVCTHVPGTSCLAWVMQRSCAADSLLCGASPVDGQPACNCPPNNLGSAPVFFANPLRKFDFDNATDPPCRAEGSCYAAPSGVQHPRLCSFPTMSEVLFLLNGYGYTGAATVVADRRATDSASLEQSGTAVFPNESFPCYGLISSIILDMVA